MKINNRFFFPILFLVTSIILIEWAKNYPSFIENYYSGVVFKYWSRAMQVLLGWIPFSVGDVLLFSIIIYGLRFVYILFKTKFKGFKHKVVKITCILSIVYCCFYLFWGLNYYREPLSKRLGYEKSTYSNEQLIDLSTYLISKLNEAHILITKSDSLQVTIPYSNEKIYLLARNGYDQLSLDFPEFSYKFGKVKSSLMSLIQSYNGVSGYFNPFTGEAQVNDKIPKTIMPTTTCHEMAHQIGFAAENEANFIGFLAALSNEDLYFKYAAYRMATRYVIFELYHRDQKIYIELYNTINKGIIKDFQESSEFWRKYKNPFEPIIKKGYNAYLESNNQKDGIKSYNYVVDLLIGYYKKTGYKNN